MKDRKAIGRIVLEDCFKNAIDSAHKEYISQAREELSQIIGITRYMWLANDINETEKNKIYNLTHLIKRKYRLY